MSWFVWATVKNTKVFSLLWYNSKLNMFVYCFIYCFNIFNFFRRYLYDFYASDLFQLFSFSSCWFSLFSLFICLVRIGQVIYIRFTVCRVHRKPWFFCLPGINKSQENSKLPSHDTSVSFWVLLNSSVILGLLLLYHSLPQSGHWSIWGLYKTTEIDNNQSYSVNKKAQFKIRKQMKWLYTEKGQKQQNKIQVRLNTSCCPDSPNEDLFLICLM